jgi:hypothetical protein
LDDPVGFAPFEVERVEVLTDRAAVIESQPRIDRQPVPHRDRVARERGGGDEHAAGVRRRARYGLKRPGTVVDEPDAGRNDIGGVVLAPFDLAADLPLVIGTKEPWPIVVEGRLGRCANKIQRAERLRSAAQDTGPIGLARCRPIAAARVVLPGVDEPSDADIPQRIGGQRMRQVAEGHRRHRCVPTQGGFERPRERRLFWVHPELVVNHLHQLQARSKSPRKLSDDLVLLVRPRECGVRARLTVVIAKILVSREEPQPIANNRPAKVRGQVTVFNAFVTGLPCAACR